MNQVKFKQPIMVQILYVNRDQFLDYARLAYSKVTICSASTFCLWPGLANLNGTTYFPLTPLIAGASTNVTAPALAAHVHWITEVEMVKEFKHYRPWHRVIDTLEGKAEQSFAKASFAYIQAYKSPSTNFILFCKA